MSSWGYEIQLLTKITKDYNLYKINLQGLQFIPKKSPRISIYIRAHFYKFGVHLLPSALVCICVCIGHTLCMYWTHLISIFRHGILCIAAVHASRNPNNYTSVVQYQQWESGVWRFVAITDNGMMHHMCYVYAQCLLVLVGHIITTQQTETSSRWCIRVIHIDVTTATKIWLSWRDQSRIKKLNGSKIAWTLKATKRG